MVDKEIIIRVRGLLHAYDYRNNTDGFSELASYRYIAEKLREYFGGDSWEEEIRKVINDNDI